MLKRSFDISPSSLDENERSVNAVVATEQPVQRFYDGEIVDEILPVKGVKLPKKTVLLSDHEYNTKNIVGSVTEFNENEQGKIEAKLTFSKTNEKIYELVKESHLDSVSIGYTIQKAVFIKKGDSYSFKGKEYTAVNRGILLGTRYKINEVSVVWLGADSDAKIRSEEIINTDDNNNQFINKNRSDNTMENEKKTENIEVKSPEEILKAERERVSEINASVRSLNLEQSFADELINDGVSIEDARKAIIDESAKNIKNVKSSEVRSGVHSGEGALKDVLAIQAKRAMGVKLDSDEYKEVKDAGIDELRGPASLAREILVDKGVTGAYRMSNEQVYKAIKMNDMSDFSAVLQDAGQSVIGDIFDSPEASWKTWCDEMDVSSFNTYDYADVNPIGVFSTVNETSDVPTIDAGESSSQFKLNTKGGVVQLSRQAFISDELGAFKRMLQWVGEAGLQTVENEVYNKLDSLTSATALTTTSGSDLDMDSIDEMDQLLRNATVDGKKVGFGGRYLIVPNKYNRVAKELTLSPTYGTSNQVNAYHGQIKPVVTGYLSGNAYYLVGPKGKTVNVVYLNGKRTPTLDIFEPRGTEPLALSFRAIMDIAVFSPSKYYICKNAGA